MRTTPGVFPRDQQVPATAATDRISLCTADVKTWMASHNLLLNEQKTEVVVIAAPNRSRVHSNVTVAVSIDVCGVSVMPKPSIRDIGVSRVAKPILPIVNPEMFTSAWFFY